MAVLGLMTYAVLTLCFVVLAVLPHQAHASSRGPFGKKNFAAVAPSVQGGICASTITIHGYICEEHEVKTKDGYIISLQRIPEGRTNVSAPGVKKQPVIVQHGIIVDGVSWFTNRPEQNLPMILADNGFDVWIPNSRGTRYSRRHSSLDASDPDYWDWTWEDMANYDLAALFDYVFNQTEQKIDYVGHSLGTLVVMAALSEGKLVNQIKSAALLCPIAYLSHVNTIPAQIAARTFVGETIAHTGFAEFDPKGNLAFNIVTSLCKDHKLDCYDLATILSGPNCCLNSSTIHEFLEHEPQPTSTKNMVHLSQNLRDGVLAKFNYVRPSLNIMLYGQLYPTLYNLANIPRDIPLFISYGGQDALADVTDVRRLLDILKFHDVDKLSVQFIKEYAHLDYTMGVNANDLVYNPVIQFFNRQF